jgi:hypothetical protein
MGSKHAHGCAQNAENGYEFLDHIVRVTGNETRVSLWMLKTKTAVKEVNAHTFTKQVEKV